MYGIMVQSWRDQFFPALARLICSHVVSMQEELKAGYSLHSFHVWHITNPSEILERGFKVSNAVLVPTTLTFVCVCVGNMSPLRKVVTLSKL